MCSSMRVGVAASVKRSCADELLCICRWYTGHFDGFAIAAFKRGRTRDVLYGEFSRPRIINDKSCGSQQCCCANWVRLLLLCLRSASLCVSVGCAYGAWPCSRV